MDGVTDSPMRQITKKYGQPTLMMTEFVNVEGFHFAKDRLKQTLEFQKQEQPLVAQIYGLTPEYFYEATREICRMGFSGVDINFGCPAKTVAASGAGAAMIQNHELAKKIVKQVRKATEDFAQENQTTPLPVSVKTRIGINDSQIENWIPFLLSLNLDLITVHGRTLKQAYTGQADWEIIKRVVEMRDKLNQQTAIFGNGDLKNFEQIQQVIKETKVDGVLVGRAAMGNPWVFKELQPTKTEKLKVAIEHCKLFEQNYQKREKYCFVPMRKHLAAYMSNFEGAREMRVKLMQANCSNEVEEILSENFRTVLGN